MPFQIWHHRPSGERYLVVAHHGRAEVAAGPLQPRPARPKPQGGRLRSSRWWGRMLLVNERLPHPRAEGR
jgi:hypothetical protein